MDILLLCSQSQARRKLLTQSGVSFQVISNHADESQCCWSNDLQQVVSDIAAHKMAHAIVPSEYASNTAYIVTADTLGQNEAGRILGQPDDYEQARKYVRENRGQLTCATAFCLEQRERVQGRWATVQRHIECVTARLYFDVPDDQIDAYIQNTNALKASGAVCVEGYGAQFVRSVTGSYSAICGLPLFELHIALRKIGFCGNC